MPLKGLAYIILVAIVVGVIWRNEIYNWFLSMFNDEDDDNK